MKSISQIITRFFFATILLSFIIPPEGRLNSEIKMDSEMKIISEVQTDDPYQFLSEDLKTLSRVIDLNYNTLDNFSARYANTVLGWVGRSRNIDENYIPQEIIDPYDNSKDFFINLGNILPYILLFSSLITNTLYWMNKKLN